MERLAILIAILFCCFSLSWAESCEAKAVCEASDVGFSCVCNRGYQGIAGACIDVDECLFNVSVCKEFETCNNFDGGFNCTCDDIDTICGDWAHCANVTDDITNSSMTSCVCNQGYSGNGTFCEDINECLNFTTTDCHTNAECNNTVGSYSCSCKSGYQGNGFNCTDINECVRETHDCEEPLSCNNLEGGFECLCGKDGKCHQDAECLEINNMTLCVCKPGHTGNGVQCMDVNECVSPSNNECDENAECTNTPGSYVCACKEGFTGDGRECNGATSVQFSILLLSLLLLSTLYIVQ